MPPERILPDDPPLWELVQTHHVVARGFHAVFDSVGLSATQFGVLAILHECEARDEPPPSQAEMARHVLVRPQSIGELLAGLVDGGLVARDGGGRGRRTSLRLTDAGRRRVAEAAPAVAAYAGPASIGLSPQEARELVRMLRTIRATLTARSES